MSDAPVVNPLVGGPYDPYGLYQPIAFPGMKATSMEDQVDTWACSTDGSIGFGLVVSRKPPPAVHQCTLGGAAGLAVGISVHDHVVQLFGGYNPYSAVSVMTRGRVWAQVSDTGTGIAEGAAVNYASATGKVTAAAVATGIVALKNATFRGPAFNFTDYTTGTTVVIADVELHYPFAA